MKALIIAILVAGCASPMTNEPTVEIAETSFAGQPYLGSVDAPLAVLAFEAPGCTSCRSFHLGDQPGSFGDLQEKYIDTGKVTWYGLQWTVGYPYDQSGGIALECVYRDMGNDAYWPMLNYVFENQGANIEELKRGMRQIGGDSSGAETCLDGQETISDVNADISRGRDYNAYQSPAFVLVGETVQGPYGISQVKTAIEKAVG